MSMKFVDVHTHPLKEYYEDTDLVIKRANSNGVAVMMVTGCSLEENKEVLKTCAKYNFTFPVIGVHPNNAKGSIDAQLLEKQITPNVKAIGEIGLDFYWDSVPKQVQIDSFCAQIDLAKKYNLPVVIHMRDSYADLYEILLKYPDVKFMIHTYSGDLYWAQKFNELGVYFSFSGVATYKNALKTIEVIDWLPVDKILTETDAPYLSPASQRGSQNVSENVKETAIFIAGIKKMPPENFVKQVYKNAKEFFKLNEKK
ncbi:TatD family hydrolase [Mycoplasma simbae]|uniref:TatD family hydrolase n=1 Tax=Mycoplasma simbae TaxID=36744 RepID=UPI0004960BAC|nr:TatD family hydrolase [Mycoplasma simbae]